MRLAEALAIVCHEGVETFADAHTHGMLVTVPDWPAHPVWVRQSLEVRGSRIEP